MEKGACVGCVYSKGGKDFTERGPVILASGGFGADFTSNSLLAQYRPDLVHLPTTNGEHCTGDGLKMSLAIGAECVDPEEPDAKVKFLAAEALRGVGGVLLDADGKRFCNELGRRDYVTGMMWKNKCPFRLCLNSKASKEIEWHCKHYKGRKLMKEYATMKDMAAELNMPLSNLEETFKEYNSVAEKQEKDPEAGPYEAYGGGKSHDVWGKKFFHNLPLSVDDTFHVAMVTPVVHYCMGGLKINDDAEVLGAEDKVINGLFGAGEANGGVHGTNRLGGNSLLDCVVYGRVCGRTAARYVMKQNIGVLERVNGSVTAAASKL